MAAERDVLALVVAEMDSAHLLAESEGYANMEWRRWTPDEIATAATQRLAARGWRLVPSAGDGLADAIETMPGRFDEPEPLPREALDVELNEFYDGLHIGRTGPLTPAEEGLLRARVAPGSAWDGAAAALASRLLVTVDAARVTRLKPLAERIEAQRRKPPWPEFGYMPDPQTSARDGFNMALDVILGLLSPDRPTPP